MTEAERQQLLTLAWRSIRLGLAEGRRLHVNIEDYPSSLREPGACFVTLHGDGELRGCIGSLQPHRPLVEDIIHNAYAAAFEDPRFSPLREEELDGLHLHISILTPAEPIAAESEAHLLGLLRPGIDGLILEEGPYRATFLPAVWEQLPEPHQFLAQLKLKAGLPANYWSPELRFSRYQCEGFGFDGPPA